MLYVVRAAAQIPHPQHPAMLHAQARVAAQYSTYYTLGCYMYRQGRQRKPSARYYRMLHV